MRRGWQPRFGAGMGGLRTPLTVPADIVQLSYGWLRGSNAHGWLQGCYARDADRRPYVEPAWPGLDPPNPRQNRFVDGVYVRAFEQPLTALGFELLPRKVWDKDEQGDARGALRAKAQ